MKLLFVVDQLPYPARNGVTIPTYNWIKRLYKEHKIDILYIKPSKVKIEKSEFDRNKEFANQVMVIEKKTVNLSHRIKSELKGDKPFFLDYTIDENKLSKILNCRNYDIVIGSPLSTHYCIEKIKNILSEVKCVAGISDCNTLTARSKGKNILLKGVKTNLKLLSLIMWLRSLQMGRSESNALELYDLILVQTKEDRRFINKISNHKLNSKIILSPNGVNELLFDIPIRDKEKNIVFIGAVEGLQGQLLCWMIDNIWSKIVDKYPEANLKIIGNNLPITLQHRIRNQKNLSYEKFVGNIVDLYNDKHTLISFAYKDNGLINKVVEAMAAGVTVIGDIGNFNYIDGFINYKHGIIIKKQNDLFYAISTLFKNDKKQIDMAQKARELIKKRYSWKRTIDILDSNFKNIMTI
jgi:glycosyltransferase involved in cell wall biosynthesis